MSPQTTFSGAPADLKDRRQSTQFCQKGDRLLCKLTTTFAFESQDAIRFAIAGCTRGRSPL